MPFIEDCYNTKKHAITGFSPYELLFGVKPNRFIDYTTEENKDEVEALAERTTQFKKLVDSTRVAVTIKLEKNKALQTKFQDKKLEQHMVKKLPLGTIVIVKVEGLRAKLEPRFHGKLQKSLEEATTDERVLLVKS